MKNTIKHYFLRLLLAVVAVLPSAAAAQESAIDDILSRGVMRVGMSSFVPWVMRSKNGDFIGFEVDVAQAVADDMGVELEIVPVAWDGIIPALLSKKFDIIICGMFVTPARNLKVNFSAVYDQTGLDMVANKDLAAGLSKPEDFNNSDVTFALRRGAYPVTFVKENMPNAKVLQFDDEGSALQEVLNGNATALVASAPTPAFDAQKYPDKLFLPLDEYLSTNQQAMALRKGDVDSLNFFNNWIEERKRSGWLQARHNYWFKSRDWADLVAE